ncbi:MAG: glycosyltransferase family 2 protein [Rudaea sp.]
MQSKLNHFRPKISVVVPTFQRRDSVARLLRALEPEVSARQDTEVVVSIDGSEDGTREMLSAFAGPLPLAWLWQANHGRAAACNAGVRAARGDLVILLDDDMEPLPGFLAEHGRAHAGGDRLGVMGAAPIMEPDSSPANRYIADKFNRHLERLALPGHAIGLRDFYSGNFSIARLAFLEAGGFDEDFTVYGNEDLELAVRLARAGVKLKYAAGAAALQHYSKTLSGLTRDYLQKGETSVLLARKHPETLAQLRLGGGEKESARWNLAMRLLLAATRVWKGTSKAVIWAAELLTLRAPACLAPLMRFTLDYFYWLGVDEALRRGKSDGRKQLALESTPRITL